MASCEVLPRPNPATASTADPDAQEEAFLRAVVRHYDGFDAHVNGSPDGTVRKTGRSEPLDSDASDVRRPVFRNAIARSVGVVGVRCIFWDFRFPVFVRFIIPPHFSPKGCGQVPDTTDGCYRGETDATAPELKRFLWEFSIDSDSIKEKTFFN